MYRRDPLHRSYATAVWQARVVPDPALLAAFVVTVTLLVLTPGPDMLFVVAVGAAGGPTAGLLAAAGVATGLAVHATATAFGLAALFAAVPTLYVVVKFGGAAYLLYLGIGAARSDALRRVDGSAAARLDPRRAVMQRIRTRHRVGPAGPDHCRVPVTRKPHGGARQDGEQSDTPERT